MRCTIEIDASALRHNLAQFRQHCPQSLVSPVLKSNAYGHGLREVYLALQLAEKDWISVNYLAEAEELRALAWKGRILVVGPIAPQDLALAYTLETDIFLSEIHILELWLKMPVHARPRAHLKLDTGMSRQGFLPEQIPELVQKFSTNHQGLVGLCSHFSNVEDVLEQHYAQQQLQHFQAGKDAFAQAGLTLLHHMAASSSALIMPESHFELIRLGISLYGVWPSRSTQLSFLQSFQHVLELKPALAWRTEVAIVKSVRSAQFIGYGCSYKALRDMTIAVLPIGYYEGYPRLASNRGYVLIKGQRCPIVGRVCMNMMMVDISHLPPIQDGERVTLIGRDGKEEIDAAQIGEWTETIHYEIFTKLNQQIPRILV